MASLFWVGGTASYNGTTNHFATSTGGTATVAAVTSADTVTFDSNSGTGTVTISANWSSGDVTVNSSNITLTTDGTHTFTVGSANTLTLTSGTIDTNGSTCSWGIFSSSNANVRTLTLGSSNVTISNNSGWTTNSVTNLTFNPNTSTITLSGANANLNSGIITFNNVVLSGGNVQVINNNPLGSATITFNNLTRTGSGNQINALAVNGPVVVNGTFTATGSSVTNRLLIKTNQVLGTSTSVTAAAVSLSNCDFRDITAAGAAIPWTGTSLGDGGNNSHITFTTPVTRFWVGNGGNWSSTTHWSTSTGGATGASVPLIHDTVVFDSSSITLATQTITMDECRVGAIDFTNVLNNPTISLTVTGGSGQEFYGSLTLKSGMTVSGTNSTNIIAESNLTITTNGVSIPFPMILQAVTNVSAITFADALVCTNGLTHNVGGWTVNSDVTCTTFTSSVNNNRTVSNFTGNFTLTGTGFVMNWSDVNLTLTNCAMKISVTDTSATTKTVSIPNNRSSFNLTSLTLAGGSGSITIEWAGVTNTHLGTLKNFTVTGPATLIFPSGQTTTLTGVLTLTGSAGNLIAFTSGTPGTVFQVTQTGTQSVLYSTFQDVNSNQGKSIDATNNCTDNGNNHNVIFAQPKRLATAGVG